MARTQTYLRSRYPTLPSHARLFFATVPRGVVFVTGPGDAPALRVWYADSTIEGSYWSSYRRRPAGTPSGPDLFLRYDSLAGWVEVSRTDSLPDDPNARWRADHEGLALMFTHAEDHVNAAEEYERLARAFPSRADYADLAGTQLRGDWRCSRGRVVPCGRGPSRCGLGRAHSSTRRGEESCYFGDFFVSRAQLREYLQCWFPKQRAAARLESHFMEEVPPMRRIFRCFLSSSALATSRIRDLATVAALAFLLAPALALAQANGKLQIHHVNVGQGDGILMISPNGQKALFDDGNYLSCTGIKTYLQGLGITSVDYHFCSHYHSDHLGCIDDLAAIGITVATAGYNRGYSYSSGAYTAYVNTLGAKRQTMTKGQIVTLDTGSPNPVQLVCVDLNGAGVYSPTGSDENAKSMVMKVSYGNFQEVIGGDLTGTGSTDVETTIGPQVGDVEVYKVHHHGSLYSTNDNWLTATTPEVGIIQVGNGNSYGHPTVDALNRMHTHGVHTYWTQTGAGATPDPSWDKVGGTIVVQADPGAGAAYTVAGTGFNDTYYSDGVPPPINTTQVATSMTMIKGSITAGDVTRLAANDAVRVSVGAGVTGGLYLTDWYGSMTLAHPPLNLNITYDGNYTVSRTQTLYLWNWTTSTWVQINSGTVSTTDVTKTWSTSSPAAYVSATREVRLRVATNTRSSSFTCRGDYMAFNYDYTPGTTPMIVSSVALGRVVDADAVFAAARPNEHDAHLTVGGAELPLAALHSIGAAPSTSGVELTWTVPVTEHVDGFNVYREDAAGMLVFAGNEAQLKSTDGIATFRFVDPSMKGAAATYWLGARGCSGPEARIGPLRVEPVAATPLCVMAAPNPAVDFARLSFELPRAAHAKLDIFDVSGRRIATPFEGGMKPGMQHVDWNLGGEHGRVEPGVYFARLQGLGRTVFTRVTVIER